MDQQQFFASGKTFNSYKEFRNEYRQYCKIAKIRYITAKSERYNKASDPNCPYKMKFFKCAKHKSNECNASFRLLLKVAGSFKNKYMITRFQTEHTHTTALTPVCNHQTLQPASLACSLLPVQEEEAPSSVLSLQQHQYQQIRYKYKIRFIVLTRRKNPFLLF